MLARHFVEFLAEMRKHRDVRVVCFTVTTQKPFACIERGLDLWPLQAPNHLPSLFIGTGLYFQNTNRLANDDGGFLSLTSDYLDKINLFVSNCVSFLLI